jgi:ketosteroid isomerase-like protein
MATQDHVKTVQDIYAAFGRQDIPFILEAFAEDAEFHEPPGGAPPFKGTYRGRDGLARFFQGLAEAVDVEAFEPREFFADGDTVVALGSYRFRAKTTGTSYETGWAMVWRFRGGKVERFHIYTDSATEAAALGGRATAAV